MQIEKLQEALRREKLDGWLFFDHHRRDPLAYKILELPDTVQPTRRWYYFVPAAGGPKKLVHRIESGALDTAPGNKLRYSSWQEQKERLGELLAGSSAIAMQYSPDCAIPYISLVDAGTVELVRSLGVRIVSSADLVQEFEARWTDQQLEQHLKAGRIVDDVRRQAFALIGEQLKNNVGISEYDVQQFIRDRFTSSGLTTDHGPIVAVNAHISDPHYEPTPERHSPIHHGDLVLIDLWAKLNEPNAVFYDVTWIGFCGENVPDRIQQIFEVVRDARKTASRFVIEKISAGEALAGYQVDDEARQFITDKGYGQYFIHRTGHSIGTDVHGAGANMDNLESHDDRRILSGSCFSIEPGVYLTDFGIRSEVNVYVGKGAAQVTGEEQDQIVRI